MMKVAQRGFWLVGGSCMEIIEPTLEFRMKSVLMLRKPANLVLKVSDFAVQSICSSKATELMHSVK